MSSVPLAICVIYLVSCLIIGILPGSKLFVTEIVRVIPQTDLSVGILAVLT